MGDETTKKEDPGVTLSIWVKSNVMQELTRKSKQLGRSKSWLVHMVLTEKLGLPPDDGFNGGDKL